MNTFQCISAYAQLYQLITGITKQKQSSAILIKADYILSFKRGRKKVSDCNSYVNKMSHVQFRAVGVNAITH